MDESYGKSDDAAYLSLPVLRVMPPNESGIARPTAVSNRNSNSSKVLGSGNTINNDNSVINHLNILHGDVPNESDTIQVKISKILIMRHVAQAVYDAQIEDGCMEDTRVQVLSEIEAWIKDLTGPQIFWLAGMMGTGKSAIAWSVCSRASKDQEIVLGGSFFCSRSTGVQEQRDIRCVVPTLAQLMARQSAKFAEALAQELERDPEVLHKQVGVQVEKLLYKPLLALRDSLVPILFVIDALDECGGPLAGSGSRTGTGSGDNDAETQRIVSNMLEALVTFSSSSVNLPVKFFVTSRPETHIRDTHVSDVKFSKVLRLHEVGKQQVTADIRLYISNRLIKASNVRGMFTDDDVRTLLGICDGLFIVASTALGHALGAGIELARARFDSLLNASRDGLSAGATGPLDHMYAVIVEDAAKVGDVETNQLTALRRILAALLSARMTLSIAALAELLGLPSIQLRASMTRLHAVVRIPDKDDDASLRPIHASFGDYLLGRASNRIRISEVFGDDALAHGCFQVLVKRLHFNVSQSRSSFESNSKPNSITLPLEYACLQWIFHVIAVLEPSKTDPSAKRPRPSWFPAWMQRALLVLHQTDLEEKINSVFRPRLLFWLEVMSVLGQIQRAAAMLMFGATTVRAEEPARFFRDANSFVASSQEAIQRSAPHIYLSALPFADKNSLVYKTFAPLCTGIISVNLTGVSHHAGRLVMTITGHEGVVNSVAYSSDGRVLASASADGTVRVWDMRSGEEITTPLRSEDGAVWSVAIAPDCKTIVSGTEGGVVCRWSLANAHIAAQRLSGHHDAVTSLMYSPDGSRLASASLDNTVRLWNAETYQQQAVLRGHTDKVHSIAFSPNSQALATGSEDHTIQLWDVATGKPRYKLPYDHAKPIHSLCFLPDGQKMVAGSGVDIIMCKPKTGKCTTLVHSGSNPVLSVSPSPDGISLVSAHGNGVCLSTLPRFLVKTSSVVLEGHTQTVRAATFSHNGLYIASVSDDHTIRIWNASGGSELQPTAAHRVTNNEAVSALIMSDCRTLAGHSDYLRSVAVSPDGAAIVSGSDDCSVRVWNAQSGVAMFPPLLGHTNWVTSVTISSDGQLIASGSRDRTIKLWDLQTGKEIGEPMQGHSDDVMAVVFSPDARWLASGSEDKTVRIWDVATQRPSKVGPISCHNSVRTVVISPDGRLVVVGDHSGYISFWQSETGQPARKPLRTNLDFLCSIGFSRDGTRIVAVGEHRTERVQVWSANTGEQILALTGHTSTVYSATYSPDGRLIVTGSADTTVRLWDAVTGAPIALPAGHGSLVRSVAFTPDGCFIVSGSDDGTIKVLDRTRATIACTASNEDTAASLSVTIMDNGWLQTPSGELLLWVPTEYHQYLYAPQGSPRVAIMLDNSGWHRGKSWTSCWRANASDSNSHVL